MFSEKKKVFHGKAHVYKVLIHVFCILPCLQRASINMIIRVVLLESWKFQHLDLQSLDQIIRVTMTTEACDNT